MKYKFTQLSS